MVDSLMILVSAKWVWLPLYAFLLYLIQQKFGWTKTLWILTTVFALLVLTDQGSVQFFKEYFQRSRPCHNPVLVDVLTKVSDKCGGQYGFISSHAANVFGLATVMFFMFRDRVGLSLLIFVWAVVVAFSRVYLAVHYPLDVFVGAGFGMICALLIWSITRKALSLK